MPRLARYRRPVITSPVDTAAGGGGAGAGEELGVGAGAGGGAQANSTPDSRTTAAFVFIALYFRF
jgi:hypothetical protein